MGAAVAVALALLRLADPAPVRDLRLAGFDYLQRLAPRPYADVPVRVVDIDETSLAALGQWPWPRDRLGELTDRLADAGAAVVVYDILFAEPDRLSPDRADGSGQQPSGHDALFARAIAGVPTVLGTARTAERRDSTLPRKSGFVAIGSDPALGLPEALGLTPVLPGLAGAAAGIGAISIGADGGGPVRRLPLAWAGPGGPVPALSLEALRVALGESTYTLYGAPDLDGLVEGIGLGEVFVPTTASGELWLRTRHEDPGLYISARDILERPSADWTERIDGHIVLVGTSAAGLLDIRTTALGETVPGVSIHAQAIEQMLLGDHLFRSDVTGGFEVLAALGLAAAVTLAIAVSGPSIAVGIFAVGASGLLASSWFAFTRGTLFDAAYPVIAGGLTFALLAAYRLIVVDRERRLIRRSFSHYVAPEVLGEIERSGHRLALGGETRDVTVLFSDIRGFTALSESLPADALVSLLNDLFDALGTEIMAERGTIDKFIGDAVMAFWNAPLPQPDHPGRAVAAALRMRAALWRVNAERGGQPIRTAVGIATGPASVGNIGSRNRFNYSVVGDTVNLAARVEAACRPVGADILVTAAVADASPGLALLDAGMLDLKGVSRRVPIFAVAGDAALAAGESFGALKLAHADFVAQLARGRAPSEADLVDAAETAEALVPGLGGFFTSLSGRADDYRHPAPEMRVLP